MAVQDAIAEYRYEVMLDCASMYTGTNEMSLVELEKYAHKCGYTNADLYTR